jgi:large subunit ribosomal protein L13
VKFTGKKITDKKYTWHTGYPGGIKHMTVKEQLERKPEEVLRKTIMGMLAKNNLRKSIGRKLRIFPGSAHLHYDMLPEDTEPINKSKDM